jgi:hypothetical protein
MNKTIYQPAKNTDIYTRERHLFIKQQSKTQQWIEKGIFLILWIVFIWLLMAL